MVGQVPMVDAMAWRQRAGSFVGGLEALGGTEIGSADSPRAGDSDHAGSMLHFVSGSLDLEVCGPLDLPSAFLRSSSLSSCL